MSCAMVSVVSAIVATNLRRVLLDAKTAHEMARFCLPSIDCNLGRRRHFPKMEVITMPRNSTMSNAPTAAMKSSPVE